MENLRKQVNVKLASPFGSRYWTEENGVDNLAYGHKDGILCWVAKMDPFIDKILV